MVEGVANALGGRRQGFTYSHQVVMGTDFDLEKMFGFKGLSFHMLGVQRAGRSVATDYLGVTGLIQPQQDYGAGGMFFTSWFICILNKAYLIKNWWWILAAYRPILSSQVHILAVMP